MQTTSNTLLRRTELLIMACVFMTALVWLVIHYAGHAPQGHFSTLETTTEATVEDVMPCIVESDACGNVTPQPATSGPHAPQTTPGSRLPLPVNGARFAPGTDSQCYWAAYYGVSCAEVKAFDYDFSQEDN